VDCWGSEGGLLTILAGCPAVEYRYSTPPSPSANRLRRWDSEPRLMRLADMQGAGSVIDTCQRCCRDAVKMPPTLRGHTTDSHFAMRSNNCGQHVLPYVGPARRCWGHDICGTVRASGNGDCGLEGAGCYRRAEQRSRPFYVHTSRLGVLSLPVGGDRGGKLELGRRRWRRRTGPRRKRHSIPSFMLAIERSNSSCVLAASNARNARLNRWRCSQRGAKPWWHAHMP
jgi:hypothetical protein